MRHVKRYRKLGRDTAHRRSMLRNLTTSFFVHGFVKTTITRAKEVKPIVEKCITYAIKAHAGDLKAYRKLFQYLHKTPEPLRVYGYLGQYKQKHQGGMTSLKKLALRRMGDGAPMACLCLLTVDTSSVFDGSGDQFLRNLNKEGEPLGGDNTIDINADDGLMKDLANADKFSLPASTTLDSLDSEGNDKS